MKALLRSSAILLCAPLVCALSSAAAFAAQTAEPYQFDLQVAPGDGDAIKAGADLSAQFPKIETTLRLAVEADPNLLRADPLVQAAPAGASRESLGLNAAWTAATGARLDLSLTDRLGQTWSPLSLFETSAHQVTTDERSASVGLRLSPLKSVDLSLTGAAAQNTVFDTVVAETSAPEAQSLLSTATQSASAGVKWRLTGWFSLDAQGKMETTNAMWRGAAASGGPTAASLGYAYFEPSVTGILDTPGQGKLGLTFEHAVSPLDAGAFSTFAAVEDRAADARFGPNREWRYRLRFDQKLAGAVKLSAAVTQGHIESATELGPIGPGLQAPVSVAGGERQELNLALSAPLTSFGLPSLTLTGTSDWRDSQVRDPFTGELRRASAEAAQTATVGLVQSLSSLGARWGLEGHFGGDQSLYQMSQVTNVSVADSVGGFIEYGPGPFAVRLQVDGLYGGDRTSTDLYYSGVRGVGYVDRTDHRTDSGQAIRLMLRKAL